MEDASICKDDPLESIPALPALVVLVVSFSFFGGIRCVKAELFSIQREILFHFIGREAIKGDVGPVVVVINN